MNVEIELWMNVVEESTFFLPYPEHADPSLPISILSRPEMNYISPLRIYSVPYSLVSGPEIAINQTPRSLSMLAGI